MKIFNPFKKFYTFFIFSLLSFQMSAQTVFDSLKIIKNGASLQQISSQFKFTEGPAVDKFGNIYFTDQPNDRIWKYSTNGNLTLFMEKTGRSNGLYIDKAGNIIACADENNEMWEISMEKKVRKLMTDFNGNRLNGPNDLWIDKFGGIYFTDPYYLRDYWKNPKPDTDPHRVFYLPKGKNTPIVMDSTLTQPNGIVGSPNGKLLYVADIKANKTYVYDITGKGKLGNRHLFTELGSDGMTLDNQGNLYITGKGVTVFNSSGKKIAHIPVPSRWTANVAIGGKARKTLFITATESVYTLEMNVSGVE